MADNAVSDALNEALDQDAFDVLDFVTGDLTPRTKVTIYTNAEAGFRLDELLAQEEAGTADVDSLSIADEVAWVDSDEVAELKAAIEASAVTFHLKGLAPKAREALQKELTAKHNFSDDADEDTRLAYFEDWTNTLTARSILRASHGDKVDPSWSADKIKTLAGRVNTTEVNRLYDAVFKINTDAEIYDRAVTADFLSKR